MEKELQRLLREKYGVCAERILPAQRGFYGETWRAEGPEGAYFIKCDFWDHHQDAYRVSLAAVDFLTAHGIDFVPRVHRTLDGRLFAQFGNGVAAVFEFVPGQLRENCPPETLYGLLARVYRLPAETLSLPREDFGTGVLAEYTALRQNSRVPEETKAVLERFEPRLSGYAERLVRFSDLCQGDASGFCITHGDAGGNCMYDGEKWSIVDWDSAALAPIERDAWIFLCEKENLQRIQKTLAENGVSYAFRTERLCYYCYRFFFYYLTAYLRALIEKENADARATLTREMAEYLSGCWIDARMDAADDAAKQMN